jgi:hypothetical protein
MEVLGECGSLNRNGIVRKKGIADAIEVCAKADITYLWVDALCIIQESNQVVP